MAHQGADNKVEPEDVEQELQALEAGPIMEHHKIDVDSFTKACVHHEEFEDGRLDSIRRRVAPGVAAEEVGVDDAQTTEDPAFQTSQAKSSLADAIAVILARSLHEEASRVAEEYMGELAEIGDDEAQARLEDLRTLLVNLGIAKDDVDDIFPTLGSGVVAADGSETDGESLQQRRDGIPDMEPELLGWTNPCGAPGDEDEPASEPPAVTPPVAPIKVDAYTRDGIQRQLLKVDVYSESNPDVVRAPLEHVELCNSHKNKRWVLATVPAANVTVSLEEVAIMMTAGGTHFPFFVGRSDLEVAMAWQVDEQGKHKPKKIALEQVALLTFKKKGAQSMKAST